MTLTEKQQEHRRWAEGLQIPPEQKQATLLLWDSLLAEVPELQVPPAWVSDEDSADDPDCIHLHWRANRPLWLWLEVTVLKDGWLEWMGRKDAERLTLPDSAVPVLPLPPEAVRVLRTYFTEESKCE